MNTVVNVKEIQTTETLEELLEQKLQKFHSLDLKIKNEFNPIIKEFEELKKELKEVLEGTNIFESENFLVTGQYKTRKEYIVKENTYWDMKVNKK